MVRIKALTPEGFLPPVARDDVLTEVFTGVDTRFDDRVSPLAARVSTVESLTVNVKSFGAVGDGAADDTAAINAAIQSLPENGGTVRFPAGAYKISDNIVSRNALGLVGDGSSSTVIWQTNTTKHGLLCNDQLYLTVQGLALVGPTTGTGIGINMMRTNNAASNYIKMDDVRLRTWGRDGLAGSNIIVSNWNNVTAVQNGRHGFNIWGTNGISTSLALNACYANENGATGFQIANSTYISMNGCASEKNQIDYQFTACQGVTLAGCGSEQSVTNAIVVSGGEAITINGWVYARKGEGVRIKNNAKGVVLNVAETNDTPPTTPALVVEAGSEYVDLGSQWKGEVQVSGTNTLQSQVIATVDQRIASSDLAPGVVMLAPGDPLPPDLPEGTLIVRTYAAADPGAMPPADEQPTITNTVPLAGNSATVDIDIRDVPVGDWMIIGISHLASTTVTYPAGWSTVAAPTTAGTVRLAVIGKRKESAEELTATITPALPLPYSAALVYGVRGPARDYWLSGTPGLRAAETTTLNTAPAVASPPAGGLGVVFSAERTTAVEATVPTFTNSEQLAWVPGASNAIETLWVGKVTDLTQPVTVTYPNSQAANGAAVQVVIPVA